MIGGGSALGMIATLYGPPNLAHPPCPASRPPLPELKRDEACPTTLGHLSAATAPYPTRPEETHTPSPLDTTTSTGAARVPLHRLPRVRRSSDSVPYGLRTALRTHSYNATLPIQYCLIQHSTKHSPQHGKLASGRRGPAPVRSRRWIAGYASKWKSLQRGMRK